MTKEIWLERPVYPLNVVVSPDPELVVAYNADLNSACLLSECFLPIEARNLLSTGYQFEQIVLLDDAAVFLGKLLDVIQADQWTRPLIYTLTSESPKDHFIAIIQTYLRNKSLTMG